MRWLGFGLIAVLAASPAAADEADWKKRLETAVARAIAENPSVAEMETRVQAARHRVGQALALPDPEIEVEIQDIPPSDFSFTRDDFTMEKITARQRFPSAGKRPALQRSAEAEQDSLSAMHAEHIAQLAAQVADAFFTIAEIDARAQILERSRERLRRVADSAAERYRVGKGAQPDVLRASLELTAIEEKLIGLLGDRRAASARFNALQALPATAPVTPLEIPETDPSVPVSPELVREAWERSPLVAAAQAGLRVAQEQTTLARLERRPEFMTKIYYAHRVEFEDLMGAGVSLNLPFFQPKRLKELEAQREAELSGARANLEMARNQIQVGVEEAYADLERAVEQGQLYRGSILPQAETNASAAQEAYAVGQIDFLTYVRAALDRDGYEGELAARRAGAWRAVAALQMASGLPLLPGTPGAEETHEKN